MSDNPMTETSTEVRDNQQRRYGPTEYFVESKLASSSKNGLVLLAIGLFGMVVGVMGLLGMNVFDRDRR